jgi:hypothetical protein
MRSLLTAACLAFAAPALADVTLAYQDAEGKPAVTLYVKGHMVRMETRDDDGGVILFNTQNDDITVLQPRQREYIVLDRATLETIQQQMRQAMQMMERFGMDPAQMGLGKTRVEARHVRTGETRNVAGHRCDVVRTEIDGASDSIACIAPPDRVGIQRADWNAMRAMFTALTRMAENMLPEGMIEVDMAPLDGVLIEARSADGKDRQVLSQVSGATLDAALFAVPSGYRRTRMEMPDMPGMSGGGRR